MTVEIEYWSSQMPDSLGDWQLNMAKQIESNRGFSLTDIERELRGEKFIMRVEADLSSQEIEDMLSDIEDHLPAGAEHVETREV